MTVSLVDQKVATSHKVFKKRNRNVTLQSHKLKFKRRNESLVVYNINSDMCYFDLNDKRLH